MALGGALERPLKPRPNRVTSVFALMLWYQAGLLGAPKFDAITTTRLASVKHTTGVVWVTQVPAPVWLSRSAGNGVTDDSRRPVSRIIVGSICGPTLRIILMPSAVLAIRVTTRWPPAAPP